MSVILSTVGGLADTALGRHPLGRHTPWADPPPRDGQCSGRYTFYWNAFLLIFPLVDPGGGVTMDPSRSIFFNFHAVFGKNRAN